MLVAPPYLYDYQIYSLVDVADRWLLNKLHVAEALGYLCGPVGVPPPAGRYCLRPMNSVRGLGAGGFFDVTVNTARGAFMPVLPGYFWCEWFDGEHRFTHFINDVAVHSSANPVTAGVMSTRGTTRFGTLDHAVALPAFLQGKSRYLLVESLDDKIIEVAFRSSGINARQEFIDDFKTVDAAYAPQDITFGNSDAEEIVYEMLDELGNTVSGKRWNDGNDNRRPFDT